MGTENHGGSAAAAAATAVREDGKQDSSKLARFRCSSSSYVSPCSVVKESDAKKKLWERGTRVKCGARLDSAAFFRQC